MGSAGQTASFVTFMMVALMASIGQLFHPNTSFYAKVAYLVRDVGPTISHWVAYVTM